jgi:hypothetical protein
VGVQHCKKAAGGKSMEIGAKMKPTGSICAKAAGSAFGGSMQKVNGMHQLSMIQKLFIGCLVCFSEMRFIGPSPKCIVSFGIFAISCLIADIFKHYVNSGISIS